MTEVLNLMDRKSYNGILPVHLMHDKACIKYYPVYQVDMIPVLIYGFNINTCIKKNANLTESSLGMGYI